MATTIKLDLFFSFFCYAGNGGYAAIHPAIKNWWAQTYHRARGDERIGRIQSSDLTDTPITMQRNLAVRQARAHGADLLCMIDSDQVPDVNLGHDAGARPFWDSSFDFVYERFCRGDYTVIGAPYCGPPPLECVYVFKWCNWQSAHPNHDHRLEMISREEAAHKGGIQEVAALPTGLTLFDLRCFDLSAPPWFYYEYTDEFESQKASTEDVTATRDIALLGQTQLGYSPIFCNWDAWAGHVKPKIVGQPRETTVAEIAAKYKNAVLLGRSSLEKQVEVGAGRLLPRIVPTEPKRHESGNSHCHPALVPGGPIADALDEPQSAPGRQDGANSGRHEQPGPVLRDEPPGHGPDHHRS